jgi:hypothetical protein
VSTNVFLGAKFCENEKNKNEKQTFFHNFLFFLLFLNEMLKFQKKKEERILSHLKFDFSLVAFLKLKFSLHRRVLKICHHLMLYPSWYSTSDATTRN